MDGCQTHPEAPCNRDRSQPRHTIALGGCVMIQRPIGEFGAPGEMTQCFFQFMLFTGDQAERIRVSGLGRPTRMGCTWRRNEFDRHIATIEYAQSSVVAPNSVLTETCMKKQPYLLM